MAEMDGNKDIEWMKNQISDIGHDTDEILEDTHMNDGIDYGAIASMLNNKGVDPAVLAMLDRGKEEGWGGGYLIVLFLILMLGFGGSGFGFGRGGADLATNDTVVNSANYTPDCWMPSAHRAYSSRQLSTTSRQLSDATTTLSCQPSLAWISSWP